MSAPEVAKRLIYHGRVQGVGFRVTTANLARGFAVDGTVRNLSDGTVELVVQGESETVAQFLASIADHFSANISDISESLVTHSISRKGFAVTG